MTDQHTRFARECFDIAVTEIEVLKDDALEKAEQARESAKVAIELSETSRANGFADALAVLHRVQNDMIRAEIAAMKAENKMMEDSQ